MAAEFIWKLHLVGELTDPQQPPPACCRHPSSSPTTPTGCTSQSRASCPPAFHHHADPLVLLSGTSSTSVPDTDATCGPLGAPRVSSKPEPLPDVAAVRGPPLPSRSTRGRFSGDRGRGMGTPSAPHSQHGRRSAPMCRSFLPGALWRLGVLLVHTLCLLPRAWEGFATPFYSFLKYSCRFSSSPRWVLSSSGALTLSCPRARMQLCSWRTSPCF